MCVVFTTYSNDVIPNLKIALRWRIEQEVIVGKGQFICGNKRCTSKEDLKTWEVNFAYIESGEKKNALVKIRNTFH